MATPPGMTSPRFRPAAWITVLVMSKGSATGVRGQERCSGVGEDKVSKVQAFREGGREVLRLCSCFATRCLISRKVPF